ncbi:MAG: peptidylprolyl isomerase [bacterium]
MRFMEFVRKKGATGIWIFAGVMLVSIIGGLGVGVFYSPIVQSDRNAGIGAAGNALPLVSTTGRYEGVAMFVNDRPVSLDDFSKNVEFMVSNYMRNNRNDYELLLQIYGETARKLVRDNVLLQQGEEYGVSVTQAEIEEERSKIIDNFLTAQDDTTGNVVGDLARNLNKNKARREAFRRFLSMNGTDNATWEKNVRQSLLVTNCQEKLQELADAEKEQKMNETRLLIDERLAAGEKFSELAREFSDDSNAENGGDLNTWVFPGLIQDEENDKALFATPVGETTEWFEIPAGLQRFQVYERRDPEGPEYEEKKPELIQKIRDEKGDDYEPTEEEIGERYLSVKARQIQLNKSDPTKVYEQIADMVDNARVEINVPYVLAYQALLDDRLYTPADVSFEDLKAIAGTAAVGANFDFEVLRPKWDNRLADNREDPEAAAEEDGAAADDGAGMQEAVDEIIAADEAAAEEGAEAPATEAEEEPAAESEPVASIEDALVEDSTKPQEADASTPLYALAIGYLKLGNTTNDETPSMFSHWMVADTYFEWMDTEDMMLGQQLDRSAARAEIEDNLSRVTAADDYNAAAFAARGLNLAWLDRADEARTNLESALRYVANSDTATLDLIQQAYEKLDDEDGLKAVEDLRAEYRQEQLEQAIQQAQSNPGNSIPFEGGQLQLPDISALEDMGAEDGTGEAGTDAAGGEAAGGSDAESGEDAGGDTAEGGQNAGEGEGGQNAGDGSGSETPPADNPCGE